MIEDTVKNKIRGTLILFVEVINLALKLAYIVEQLSNVHPLQRDFPYLKSDFEKFQCPTYFSSLFYGNSKFGIEIDIF